MKNIYTLSEKDQTLLILGMFSGIIVSMSSLGEIIDNAQPEIAKRFKALGDRINGLDEILIEELDKIFKSIGVNLNG